MYAHAFLLLCFIFPMKNCVWASTFNLVVVYNTLDQDVLAAAQFAAQLINASRLSAFNFAHSINLIALNISDDVSLTMRVCSSDWVWPSSIDGVIDLTRVNSLNVRDMAYQLNAPFMSANWDDIADMATIRPNPINYVKAINSLLLRNHYVIQPRILILYEETFTKDLINSFKSVTMQPSIYYRLIPQNTSDLVSLLAWAKMIKISELVVGSSTRLATNVLEAGFKVGLTNEFVHWYFVSKDLASSVIRCTECSILTPTMALNFRRDAVDSLTLNNLLTAVNLTTNGGVASDRYIELVYAFEAVEALTLIINKMILNNQWTSMNVNFSCFFTSDATLTTRFTNAQTSTTTLTYDSILGVVSFDGTLQNQADKFNIYQNSIVNGQFSISNLAATWDSRTDLSSSANNIAMKYLTNDSLRVLVKNEPPFVIIKNDTNGSLSFDGYSVEILKLVTSYLNLSYTLIVQEDGIYGELLSNGSWNGMIGKVINGQADMALGAITINSERETVVDFSIPYYDYAGIQLVVSGQTNPTSGDQIFFLKAFTWEVWLVVGMTILIVGLLISMMDWLSPFSFQNRLKCNAIREGETEGKVFSIKESMWFVLGAYTQAGDSFDPRSFSCRIVVVGFWLFTYLMMAMYTANLAAQLTVAKLNAPPDSMDTYLDQTTYMYSVIKNSDAYYYFKRREQIENLFYDYWINSDMRMKATAHSVTQLAVYRSPLYEKYKDVFFRMSQWNFTKDVEDSVNMMKSKNYAIFMETPTIKYIRSTDCDLTTVGEAVAWRPYGIVLPNNSPLTKQLNMALLILQSDRTLETLKTAWWSKNNIDCPVDDPNKGLNLDTLGGTFLFLLGGIGVAVCVLFIEKMVVHIWGMDWIKKTDMTAMISTANLQKTREKLLHDNTICCGCLTALQISSMRNLLTSTKVSPEKQHKIILSVPCEPIVNELHLDEFDQALAELEGYENQLKY